MILDRYKGVFKDFLFTISWARGYQVLAHYKECLLDFRPALSRHWKGLYSKAPGGRIYTAHGISGRVCEGRPRSASSQRSTSAVASKYSLAKGLQVIISQIQLIYCSYWKNIEYSLNFIHLVAGSRSLALPGSKKRPF